MAEPRRAFGPYRPAVGARADAPPLRPWTDLAARLAGGPVIATLNLHSTPRHREREFAAQIAHLGERFDPLTEDGLDAITGGWTPPRPVVMPILFEGFRDNLEVVLPMIEAAGLVAWLVIPPGFLDLDAQDQRLYAAAHHLDHPGEEPRGERIALTWEEARAIAARGHVFGCHSRSHFEPRPDTSEAMLEWEIAGGQALMRRRLGRPTRLFCWLRGAGAGLDPRADAILRREGFRHLLSNTRIQRLA